MREADKIPGKRVAKTKADLIELLATRKRLTHAHAESIVNQVLDAMTAALVRGEGIEIRGFGTFSVRSYEAYQGRNPRSGRPVQVGAKRLPFFKVGKELRERVNFARAAEP